VRVHRRLLAILQVSSPFISLLFDFVDSAYVYALSAPVGVECCVAGHLGLGGSHALEVKRMDGMGNVLFHDGQNSFLAL